MPRAAAMMAPPLEAVATLPRQPVSSVCGGAANAVHRPPALTADTASGAGLQGGTAGEVQRSNGDANLAPLEGRKSPTPPNP